MVMTVKGITWEDGRVNGEIDWKGRGQEAGRIRKNHLPRIMAGIVAASWKVKALRKEGDD